MIRQSTFKKRSKRRKTSEEKSPVLSEHQHDQNSQVIDDCEKDSNDCCEMESISPRENQLTLFNNMESANSPDKQVYTELQISADCEMNET